MPLLELLGAAGAAKLAFASHHASSVAVRPLKAHALGAGRSRAAWRRGVSRSLQSLHVKVASIAGTLRALLRRCGRRGVWRPRRRCGTGYIRIRNLHRARLARAAKRRAAKLRAARARVAALRRRAHSLRRQAKHYSYLARRARGYLGRWLHYVRVYAARCRHWRARLKAASKAAKARGSSSAAKAAKRKYTNAVAQRKRALFYYRYYSRRGTSGVRAAQIWWKRAARWAKVARRNHSKWQSAKAAAKARGSSSARAAAKRKYKNAVAQRKRAMFYYRYYSRRGSRGVRPALIWWKRAARWAKVARRNRNKWLSTKRSSGSGSRMAVQIARRQVRANAHAKAQYARRAAQTRRQIAHYVRLARSKSAAARRLFAAAARVARRARA